MVDGGLGWRAGSWLGAGRPGLVEVVHVRSVGVLVC